MLSATSDVFALMLGDIFPSWLSTEPCQYLMSILIFGIVISFVISFFKF